MLRGNAPAKIDEKGRLKIPNAFRAVIQETHGSDVFVTSLDGAVFATKVAVELAPASVGGTFEVANNGSSATVTLGGTPAASEVWRLTLNVGGVLSTFAYTVPGTGASADTIAAALRASLAAGLGSAWTVSGTGGSIEIARAGAGVFTAAFAIQPFTLDTNASASSVLLQGTPVNPVEWWDSHWMQDRVLRKITEAGGTQN